MIYCKVLLVHIKLGFFAGLCSPPSSLYFLQWNQASQRSAFAFKMLWKSSVLLFSALDLANLRILLLLFPNPLAYCRAYFLSIQLCNHQNPLLIFRSFSGFHDGLWKSSILLFHGNPAFHRLIFSTSALDLSHQTLSHSAQLLLFSQQIIFSVSYLRRRL